MAELSAAVNIMTVLHFTYRTIRRLKEYADSAVEVPRRVRPVLRCVRMLSVTLSNIEGIKTELAIPEDIDEAIRGLKELIDELEGLLPGVMKFPNDGRWDRIRKGIRSVRMERMLMEYVDEMNSSTIQLGAWIGSVDLRRSVLGVLLLRWFTRKRPSTSDWSDRNFGQVLRGGFIVSQGGSRSPHKRRVRKVAYRTANQGAFHLILGANHCSGKPVETHEMSWVDPKFRTAGNDKSAFAPGRVLKTYWFEPSGTTGPETPQEARKIRRFVVIETRRDHSIAVPNITFESRSMVTYSSPSQPRKMSPPLSYHNWLSNDVQKRNSIPNSNTPASQPRRQLSGEKKKAREWCCSCDKRFDRNWQHHEIQGRPTFSTEKLSKLRTKLSTYRAECERPGHSSALAPHEEESDRRNGEWPRERVKRPLDPALRARKDLFRSVGTCMDCRRKKEKCSLSHHALEDLLIDYPDAADDVRWAMESETDPNQSNNMFKSSAMATIAIPFMRLPNSEMNSSFSNLAEDKSLFWRRATWGPSSRNRELAVDGNLSVTGGSFFKRLVFGRERGGKGGSIGVVGELVRERSAEEGRVGVKATHNGSERGAYLLHKHSVFEETAQELSHRSHNDLHLRADNFRAHLVKETGPFWCSMASSRHVLSDYNLLSSTLEAWVPHIPNQLGQAVRQSKDGLHRHKDYTRRFSNHERSSDTAVLDTKAITGLWITRCRLRYQETCYGMNTVFRGTESGMLDQFVQQECTQWTAQGKAISVA